MIDTCEYLARVGFAKLLDRLGGPAHYNDDDVIGEQQAKLADNERVLAMLRDADAPSQPANYDGCDWCGQSVTWPDRLPDLKVWAGQMTLAKIVRKHVGALKGAVDPFSHRAMTTGVTGLDYLSANIDAVDSGFSPNKLGLPIDQRPAVELLAIVGLEGLPLVSFAKRDCGFIHDEKIWRFAVELRDGGYLRRWCWMNEHAQIGV